jgi:hypothetical protein
LEILNNRKKKRICRTKISLEAESVKNNEDDGKIKNEIGHKTKCL